MIDVVVRGAGFGLRRVFHLHRSVRTVVRLGVLFALGVVLPGNPEAIMLGELIESPADLVSDQEPIQCRQGYKTIGLLRDYALGRKWIVVANCLHPERPRQAVAEFKEASSQMSSNASGRLQASTADELPPPMYGSLREKAGEDKQANTVPAVRSGGLVHLWRKESMVHLDLHAFALADGAPGSTIRLRVVNSGAVLQGIVRGPGSVEILSGSTGYAGKLP